MEKYLEEAPKSWKYRLVLAAVPKDGAPYEDSFSVHIDRPVSYWDQIYTFLSDPQVRVEAYRSEGRVLVTVSLRTEVSVPCARCLEPARTEIGGELGGFADELIADLLHSAVALFNDNKNILTHCFAPSGKNKAI